MDTRLERDPLGERAVPAEAYYGIQTARAVENFPISGLRAPADLVSATVLIKKAAAHANVTLGRLDQKTGEAIARAAETPMMPAPTMTMQAFIAQGAFEELKKPGSAVADLLAAE